MSVEALVLIAMVDQKPGAFAYEAFEDVDGIEINGEPTEKRILVKVMDESAVGEFFRICREYDVERSATNRQDLHYTVMDSWVRLHE